MERSGDRFEFCMIYAFGLFVFLLLTDFQESLWCTEIYNAGKIIDVRRDQPLFNQVQILYE